MYGSIEFGGTKIRCAYFDEKGTLLDQLRIKTSLPKENMVAIKDFYYKKNIQSFSIGAFGPINLNNGSDEYGMIQNTPKKGWKGFNLYKAFKKIKDVNINIVTDVGLSAIGEYWLGAGKSYRSILYLTIGTGIGGAYIQDGKILNGYSHPEMGHIFVHRLENDKYSSVCAYHDNCLEGMASGPSIKHRKGIEAKDIDLNDEVFCISSTYTADALYTYSLILRPEVIILGGGLVNKEGYIELIRKKFDKIKGSYIDLPRSDRYIVKPFLGDDAALYGGYYLAKNTSDK